MPHHQKKSVGEKATVKFLYTGCWTTSYVSKTNIASYTQVFWYNALVFWGEEITQPQRGSSLLVFSVLSFFLQKWDCLHHDAKSIHFFTDYLELILPRLSKQWVTVYISNIIVYLKYIAYCCLAIIHFHFWLYKLSLLIENCSWNWLFQQAHFSSCWDLELWYLANWREVTRTLSNGFTRRMNMVKKEYFFKTRQEGHSVMIALVMLLTMLPWWSVVSVRKIKACTGVKAVTAVTVRSPPSSESTKVWIIIVLGFFFPKTESILDTYTCVYSVMYICQIIWQSQSSSSEPFFPFFSSNSGWNSQDILCDCWQKFHACMSGWIF